MNGLACFKSAPSERRKIHTLSIPLEEILSLFLFRLGLFIRIIVIIHLFHIRIVPCHRTLTVALETWHTDPWYRPDGPIPIALFALFALSAGTRITFAL